MKAINWGILATGTIARKFAGTLAQMPDCSNLIAVASRNVENAATFASAYHIDRAYGSYVELALDPDVEVVYIATPHSAHFEAAKLCLENNKSVLCEKTFTTNAAQARELIELAKEKKMFIMEAFWTKFLPAYDQVRQLIAEGAIGEITHFRAQYGFAPTGARYIRKFDPRLAGGALLDIGVYAIGVATMILGYNPLKVHSSCIVGEYGTDRLDSIMMEYDKGVTAHLVTTIGSIMDQQGVIYGTKGHIVLPEFSALQQYHVEMDDGTRYTRRTPFEVNGFEYQIREVETCLKAQQSESCIMTHQNTVDVIALMDKMRLDWGLVFPCE